MKLRTRCLAALLASGLAACGGVSRPDRQQGEVVVAPPHKDARGDYAEYSVLPTDDVALAFLGQVTHAGNLEGSAGETYRVFELYDHDRVEVAVARDGKQAAVWNLSAAVGLGVDEIDSMYLTADGDLDVWVYEEGAEWALWRVDLGGEDEISVERRFYGEYVEPEVEAPPKETKKFAVDASEDPRYAALPVFVEESMIDFQAPTVGSAHILQVADDSGSRVLIGLRVGDAPERIYDTSAHVKHVIQGYEIEPGYFDMEIDPVCPSVHPDCASRFNAIGVGFDLGDDGKSLEDEAIVVHLEDAVG